MILPQAVNSGELPMPIADQPGVVAGLRRWVVETALPLWSSVGFDERHGGFHERLHLDGTPDFTAARRVRVQARQIYVYAHAASLGWFADGLPVALRAFELMLGKYRSPDGAPGFVHALAADGSVANPLRDTYDHAFILLALAWLAHASGDSQIRAIIGETLAFLDEHLAAGDGTFFEDVARGVPRRQNPHMHLLEAMLALHETASHTAALERATPLRNLLEAKFLDASTGMIGEYFTPEWMPWRGAPGAPVIEPGHHAEWAWLLRRYERTSGEQPGRLPSALLSVAVRCACPRTGFLPDEVTRSGTVLRASRRCWPQAELAKAWLAEQEIGRPDAGPAAVHALQRLQSHYLAGPIGGGWIDQFDGAGKPMADYIPASTFYHVFSAVAEACRVFA